MYPPAVWLFCELRCNAGAFCGDGQGTGGAGAVGALNRYHSPNDHPAHGAVSGCVIWLARPILLGMMLQDFPTAKRCGNTFEAKLVRKVWKVESESEQWTHVK